MALDFAPDSYSRDVFKAVNANEIFFQVDFFEKKSTTSHSYEMNEEDRDDNEFSTSSSLKRDNIPGRNVEMSIGKQKDETIRKRMQLKI